MGNLEHDGRVYIVWGERVGLDPRYTWGGAVQLATAEIVLVNGLPTLVNYQRNLTPTPLHPDGKNLWSNPGGNTVIGAGYEPWAFSPDDAEILFASDVFLSVRIAGPVAAGWPPKGRKTTRWSQAFTDVVAWKWQGSPSLRNITAYNPRIYDYDTNGGSGLVKYLGHWEEPATYAVVGGREYIAFASSQPGAALEPGRAHEDLRVGDVGGSGRPRRPRPAGDEIQWYRRRTLWAYPTAADWQRHAVYLTLVPGGKGANPPGAIYRVTLAGR